MIGQFLKKRSFFEQLPDELKMISLYRYVSLIFISLVYLLNEPEYSIGRKALFILCMAVSAILLNYLYIKSRGSTGKIVFLILIETVSNFLLLIPSGGVKSPYIWYSLNTILIASVELNRKLCWLNLFVYLFGSSWVFYLVFNAEKIDFFEMVQRESNLMLSLVLMTGVIQQLAIYAKKLQNERNKLAMVNDRLRSANAAIKESMNYIMELYHTVHLFTTQNSKDELIELMLHYAKKISKAGIVVFCSFTGGENRIIVETDSDHEEIKDAIKFKISGLWKDIVNSPVPITVPVHDKVLLLNTMKSNYGVFGILGIEISSEERNKSYMESVDKLTFLSDLSAVVFERFELEQVNERLLVNAEQNRIANVIHDSVLQRLFSVSCGIFSIIKRNQEVAASQLNEDLNLLRISINEAMKELRSAIYGLSWKKDGEDKFIVDIMKYINQTRRFNNIDIDFAVNGNSEFLNSAQKKALYRVICEGIGNAVRHGKAKCIQVELNIQPDKTSLSIIDNGIGFDPAMVKEHKRSGLGLTNMDYLIHSLRGTVNLYSEPGKGTEIKIAIPHYQLEGKVEVV